MNYLTLPIGPSAPAVINAIVEIPHGETNKYEYDKDLHVFRLDRPLFSSVHYPGDYGFIPSTLSEDGDALDILVLVDAPSFPGCLIEARPVGALQMLDQGIKDLKVLAVAATSPYYQDTEHLCDLPPHLLDEIKHFFSVYKQLEGKQTEVTGWLELQATHDIIIQHHRRFDEVEAMNLINQD